MTASTQKSRSGRLRSRLFLGALLLVLGMPAAGQIDIDIQVSGGDRRSSPPGAQPSISIEQATNIVRSRYAEGRVVSARPTRRGNDTGYRVRVVLEDGRVINVFVDGQGRIR